MMHFIIILGTAISAAWSPLVVDSNRVAVQWQEKYGAAYYDTCVGLWENNREYMLTQRDSEKRILLKSNINHIFFYRLKEGE